MWSVLLVKFLICLEGKNALSVNLSQVSKLACIKFQKLVCIKSSFKNLFIQDFIKVQRNTQTLKLSLIWRHRVVYY